jgi:drebrin-like protein
MGFFDRKRPPEDGEVSAGSDDLPVVPKSAPPPPPLASQPPLKVDAAPTAPPIKAAPPPPPPAAEPAFTIDDAVVLMRTLPNRNIDLVMQVVKKTLESVHVDVSRIIEGATKKEAVIEERVGALKKEIEKLEGQIAAAKKEIAGLDADQKEISTVKERLLLAQKVEAEVISDRPAPPASPPPPKPVVSAVAPVMPPPPPKVP